MNARQAAIILTLALAALLRGQPSEVSNGEVTFESLSSMGRVPISGTLSIWSQAKGTVYQKQIQDEVSVKLPYGDYSIVFSNTFFRFAQTITVDQPKSLVVLFPTHRRLRV